MDEKYKFCPRCNNLLTLSTEQRLDCYRFECSTCPFVARITRKISYKKHIVRERDGDKEGIVDLAKENQRRMKTQVICPECSHTEAFFFQMQTRSADEPMTNFYECSKCNHNWRD